MAPMPPVMLAPEHWSGCLAVAESLPEWFGYPDALEGIARALETDSGFVVASDGEVAAFVTFAPRFEETIEITYLAVHRDHRRGGHGRMLVRAVRDAAAASGASRLCLVTLGPSADNRHYDETVAFYRAIGFDRVRELYLTDWGGAPTLVMSARLSDLD